MLAIVLCPSWSSVASSIDDCWQECNSGPGGVGFHDASGYPIVNTTRFPNMKAMTTKAKQLGLKPGWYANNVSLSPLPGAAAMSADTSFLLCDRDADTHGIQCDCKDTSDVCMAGKCFSGDVKATLDYGFVGIKLDGCSVNRNITLFAELFNATGQPTMLENCHNGNPTYPSSPSDAPFNFFRSSQDIRPTYGSVVRSRCSHNGSFDVASR